MISAFRLSILPVMLLFFGFSLNAQLAQDEIEKKSIPAVFQIGEYESEFEGLSFSHNTSLLTACDDNMDMAYAKWLEMLESLENFAHSNGVDLNGVKMWLNVFWDENGGIDHMAYYLKPQSKNMDHRYLNALLKEFTTTYEFPLTFPGKFSHYGLARFPVFAKPKLAPQPAPAVVERQN